MYLAAESNKLYLMVSYKSCSISVIAVFPRVLCWTPFTIYNVCRCHLLIVSGPVLMFADDTKIIGVITNGDDFTALQNDLDLLYRRSQ